jgi:putative CocE/NonD family hydrolase
MNRRDLIGKALTLASVPTALAVQGKAEAETTYSPKLDFTVRIPMRDGTHLSARLYLPRELKTPRPVVYSLTCYVADGYHEEGLSMSEHGYPYLSVDIRSRGDSEGEFTPFFAEPDDGHDIVEWIAKQPWCNGKVAMRGLSYVGWTQWANVRGAPAHLATIVPSAPCYVGYDFPLRYNIFFSFAVTWLARTYGHPGNDKIYNDGAFWSKEHLRFLESGLPFKKMDEFFGLPSKPFKEWMEHPHQSDYWDRANPTPEQFASLTMPVLSLCGAYDGDQLGTIEFYRQHLKAAGAKANHYLVIGPWGHIEVRFPKTEFYGIKVGKASAIDMPQLHRDWYAFTMEGGPRPEFLKDKVAYYVMVADKWRYAPNLEAVTARHKPLYLQSTENASSVFNAGQLGLQPAKASAPDHYVYDPRDLSVPRLEIQATQSHLTDQTMIVSDVGEKLIYHSAPFTEDTEVSGHFKFDVWLGLDQPDTDFMVSIYDISTDGSSMFLTEEQQRARYREGLRVEKLITTKAPLKYAFNRFFFISRLIKKGHRLRLVIRPHHSIGWEKNYNSDKPVADQTMADARTITVKLYHDAQHPSVLHVPIAQAEA